MATLDLVMHGPDRDRLPAASEDETFIVGRCGPAYVCCDIETWRRWKNDADVGALTVVHDGRAVDAWLWPAAGGGHEGWITDFGGSEHLYEHRPFRLSSVAQNCVRRAIAILVDGGGTPVEWSGGSEFGSVLVRAG